MEDSLDRLRRGDRALEFRPPGRAKFAPRTDVRSRRHAVVGSRQSFRMRQEISPEEIQQVLQGISVPPQPQIMVDLQMEQVMPNPDLKTIARLISQDPGLSGALLKLVNSPYFGLTNRISSIQRAAHLLGSSTVIVLINALSIKCVMTEKTIVTLNRYWESAHEVTVGDLPLAKPLGVEAPDKAYSLGLYHN